MCGTNKLFDAGKVTRYLELIAMKKEPLKRSKIIYRDQRVVEKENIFIKFKQGNSVRKLMLEIFGSFQKYLSKLKYYWCELYLSHSKNNWGYDVF